MTVHYNSERSLQDNMRLIIISNRLPLTITRTNNTFSYKETSGGLVTGLKAVKQTLPFLWIGNISGMNLTEEEKDTITRDCWEFNKSIPVFISKELNEQSYNGFCNGILWPILHTFPDDVSYDPKLFSSYTKFNEIFCDKICELVEEEDIIWVHDYHLMLLPNMLRERLSLKLKKFSIGFFLHTPFSPADVFGQLPCVKQIVEGIMGSDHVAFHTYDYLAHFLDTCTNQLPKRSSYTSYQKSVHQKNLEKKDNKKNLQDSVNVKGLCDKSKSENKTVLESPTVIKKFAKSNDAVIDYHTGDIDIGTRKIRCMAIPIGIDPELFKNTLKKTETKNRIQELKTKYKGKTLIIGVDRTDFIKGIPNRILGFHNYLKKQNVNKDVIFLQICVPSRLDVPEYASLMNRINTLTAELNGSIGNVDDTYMHVLSKSVQFEELCALYSVADVCCISSLMDGMNLVALEYVACQDSNKGVLMLSEFAGCASTLPGSVFFNPWNVDEIANTFEAVINMSQKERDDRHTINSNNVTKFTAVKWAKDNVKCLQEINGNLK
ncbi:alpha,alpha-trehalose-phosphate synthase (UDP-forming) [Edhazardia aedis USNM 41457]|uniref:Alpha,alpha-trehalose-phosphate synthase (UDP-forming) n=1 Tax=Edhazardia aedis (strain USNM 41457) TaxID=1003232 RepID=J9DRC5_EDHAE|nr:alpha,alpha-trehalose-phosphate synthase (UDP-forming) [Edhazardia aedis USNM 41457]|eukprot:EJW05110.1 alpha,alpha-trehalose-phosphate synthase (UDP-forming) [Edhazardia aedis USNM 41457]